MQSMGTQTSPKASPIHTGPVTHDVSTSPINFLPGAPSTTGTSRPPSRTSAMQYIDEAACRMQGLEAFQHLPPLPKTAQELLSYPTDPDSDADDESEASGVQGDGDNRANYSEGDLCLTGRGAPRQGMAPGGNGGGNWQGNGGGQGRDRNGRYGQNWDGGSRDQRNYNRNRGHTSYSQSNIGPTQSVSGIQNPPSGDPDTCIASHSITYQSQDARSGLQSMSGVPDGSEGRGVENIPSSSNAPDMGAQGNDNLQAASTALGPSQPLESLQCAQPVHPLGANSALPTA